MTVTRYALILALVFLPASPFATTFPVTKTADTNSSCTPGNCSLREAIDAANTNPGADDVPVPAGTYLLTLGQLVVSDDVSIAGAGQANTVIDGNATDRVFDISSSGGAINISGVTIQNGYHPVGAGIRVHNSDLNLTNSTLSGNTATSAGGGLYSTYTDVTLTNSTVSGNTVSGTNRADGGGISMPGGEIHNPDLIIINSTVSSNSATSLNCNDCNRGGGIFIGGSLSLTDSTVSGNDSGLGGGIYSSGYYLVLTDSVVSNNSAILSGGGVISNYGSTVIMNSSTVSGNDAVSSGGILNSGYLTLTDSTVSGNTVQAGAGGILNWFDSYATLTNSTVSGNTVVSGDGGGIFNLGSMTLTNSTVSGNSSSLRGGGIAEDGIASLTNTIMTDNFPYNCGLNNNVNSLGYNLTDDTSCGSTATGDLVVADAMLYPLGNFGGPTKTHHPMTGSPAIDAANNANCPADDQRGESRPFDGDDPPDGFADCDIGSVEYLPEPHHAATLVAGAALLALLYRRRARRLQLG